ncbi:MAG: hypothetical protein LRY30_01280, partial [Gammaproteobacteria bacterium]|nr:hypothetical protein [Gammaproteobacteria bacterium]
MIRKLFYRSRLKRSILQLCHNSDINAPQTKKNLKIGIKQNSCTVTSIYDDLFFLMVAVLSCQSLNVDHASARKILETLCLKKQEYQDLIRGFPQVGLSDLRNLSLEYMLNDVDNCYGYAIFVADTLKEILRSSTALMLEQKWLTLRSVADYNRKVFSCFALAIPVLGVLRVEDDNDSVCRELLNLILNQESSLSQSSFDEAQRVWRNEILSLWGAADQIDPSTKTGILWGSLYPDSGPIPNMTHNTLAKIFTLCARGETIDQRVDSVFPPAIDFIENQFSELSRPRLSFFSCSA